MDQQDRPGAVRRPVILALTALGALAAVGLAVWALLPGATAEQRDAAWALEGVAELVAFADRDAVTDVATDADGEVWAATRGGVLEPRQDGWVAHTGADGLPSSNATALALAEDGTVWAGTEAGVSHLDDGGWVVHDGEHGPGDGQVRAVEAAPDGSVWAATSEAVAQFDGRNWSRHDHGARDLAVADDGTVWSTAPGQVRAFDGVSWSVFDDHTDSGPLHDEHDHPWAVISDDGAVWIGTERGVSRFDGDQWERHSLTETVRSGSVTVHALADDGDDGVWAATDGQGVWHTDGDGWVPASDGLPERSDEVQPHPRVTALDRDQEGRLAAGVSGAGVAWFEDGRWTLEDPTDGLPAGDVRSVTVDGDTVWAGTADGAVWRGQDESWTRFTTADGLPDARVLSVAATDAGTVWAGTDRGLARLDDGRWTRLTDEGPVPSVHALTADGEELWVATDSGVWHHDSEHWTGHTAAAGVPGRVLDLTVDDDGMVWAGTDDGVVRYDGRWEQLGHTHDVPDERVAAVARSGDTTLWAGYYPDPDEAAAEGVMTLEHETAEPGFAGVADGVSSSVAALAVADDGTVWAGGQEGVSRHADGLWQGYPLAGLAHAVDLAPADDGTVWVATGPGGLARLHLDAGP